MFFREADGSVPVLEWLGSLETRTLIKCRARLSMLREAGHLLRRPQADYIGDGLYERRILRAGQRHRILYGFHDRQFAILLVGFAKSEARIPAGEIRLARQRFERFMTAPEYHSHFERDE